MKNLLYKEFKLVLHPVCILLIVLFPLLALIPNYPKFIAFIYIFTCYPIIFIGANKGTNTNDVFYSLTLPCRRKDIVLARIILLSILHLVCALLTTIFFLLSPLVSIEIPSDQLVDVGFGLNALPTTMGFSFIALGFLDLFFLPLFYKTARNITASCLVGGLIYSLILMLLNIGIPYTPVIGDFFAKGDALVQILTLLFGLIIYTIIRYIAYRISYKRFEKVDF